MRKPTNKAIIIVVILLNINIYSQKNFINFYKIKVENISSIEENFNSKVYESKLEYIESTKDSIIRYGKLKNYSRPENKLYGKIEVTYFYLKKDSIVRKINYSWIASENSSIEDYNKQFDKTVKIVSDELNLQIGEQGKLEKIIDNFIDGKPEEINERRVTLKYKNAKILILMVWSEKHGANIITSVEWEK
jgi:hypothetical protein